jgi:hypothetical protein
MGWGCWPHAQPPTWWTKVSLFVWILTPDLPGMEDLTSSICYRQHSCRNHMITQAPPLSQSRDIYGGLPTINVTISPSLRVAQSLSCLFLSYRTDRDHYNVSNIHLQPPHFLQYLWLDRCFSKNTQTTVASTEIIEQ